MLTGTDGSRPAQRLGGAAHSACAAARRTRLPLTRVLAPQLGVQIDELAATARFSAELAGLLRVDGSVPYLQPITVDIELVSRSPDDHLDTMHQAWLDRCPV